MAHWGAMSTATHWFVPSGVGNLPIHGHAPGVASLPLNMRGSGPDCDSGLVPQSSTFEPINSK